MVSDEGQTSAAVTAAALLLGIKDVSCLSGYNGNVFLLCSCSYLLSYCAQVSNVHVFGICSELAQGRVLPAGWTSGYDNQKRQYFVDEVLQLLAPTCHSAHLMARQPPMCAGQAGEYMAASAAAILSWSCVHGLGRQGSCGKR